MFQTQQFSNLPELIEGLEVTDEERQDLFDRTVNQAECDLWKKVRVGRLTASKFGEYIYRAKKGKSLTYNFYPKPFSSEACQWGRDHESDGVKEYERKNNVKVQKCGFMLSRDGKFGGSPDGYVQETETLVEVKCPFSKRNVYDLDSMMRQDNNWWLVHSSSSQNNVSFNLKVAQGRAYYHQIQGCMWLMDCDKCDLVVWTPYCFKVVHVQRNEGWARENVPVLTQIWDNELAPRILRDCVPLVSIFLLLSYYLLSQDQAPWGGQLLKRCVIEEK